MSHELMQQGSELLINTSHALHDLTKQDYCVATVNVVQSQTVLPPHGNKPGDRPSQVEIVDVTDSADVDHEPLSAPTDALPFPSVTLPFEVP